MESENIEDNTVISTPYSTSIEKSNSTSKVVVGLLVATILILLLVVIWLLFKENETESGNKVELAPTEVITPTSINNDSIESKTPLTQTKDSEDTAVENHIVDISKIYQKDGKWYLDTINEYNTVIEEEGDPNGTKGFYSVAVYNPKTFELSPNVVIEMFSYSRKSDGDLNWGEIVSLENFIKVIAKETEGNINQEYVITVQDNLVIKILENFTS